MTDSVLPNSVADHWTSHNTVSGSLRLPDDAELIVRFDHESGDHKIRILSTAGEAMTQWFARGQSMHREDTPELRLEQQWEVQSLEEARLVASVKTGTISTMENRCKHKLRYALDGPVDY